VKRDAAAGRGNTERPEPAVTVRPADAGSQPASLYSISITVQGWRWRCRTAVLAFNISTKLLYVEPGEYWDV